MIFAQSKSGLYLPAREILRAYDDADYERWINKRRAPFQVPWKKWAGPTVGATTGIGSDGTTSTKTTASITTAATGSLLVVFFCHWDSVNFSSFTDNKSNAWTQIQSELTQATQNKSRMYYAASAIGGSGHTFTVNTSANAEIDIMVVELLGCATVAPLDQSDRRFDNATPYTLAAGLTTTLAAEILVTATCNDSGSNPATFAENGLSGSVVQASQPDGTHFVSAIATSIQTATGTFNPSWTSVGSTQAHVWLATFKAVAPMGAQAVNHNLAYWNGNQGGRR